MESMAARSMISARNITERIFCKSVSVRFAKYQFIDSEKSNIADWQERRDFWQIPDDRPSIESLFGRCDSPTDTLSIFGLFDPLVKSYHLQGCSLAAGAQLLNIKPNCFPFDKRSSQKVVLRHS
jgi:hypothetical protein